MITLSQLLCGSDESGRCALAAPTLTTDEMSHICSWELTLEKQGEK